MATGFAHGLGYMCTRLADLLRNKTDQHNMSVGSKSVNQRRQNLQLLSALRELPSPVYFVMITNVFFRIVRDVISNWILLILLETRDFTPHRNACILALFEFGGIVGGITAGRISDKRRLAFGICMRCSGGILLGAFLSGPQMMVGLFAMESAPVHLDSFAASVVGLCAQVGGVFSGYPISVIKTVYGWDGILLALPAVAAICCMTSAQLWGSGRRKQKINYPCILKIKSSAGVLFLISLACIVVSVPHVWPIA
eukprot:gene6977-9580_t